MSYQKMLPYKKKILHIADKNALAGGVGTVLDYLKEGIDASKDFQANALITSYDHKNKRPGDSKLSTGAGHERSVDQENLEDVIKDYDIIHVHGIPHYGVLEAIYGLKKKGKNVPKIVNTAHSSVKQEFLAQFEFAKDSKDPDLKADFKELKYFKDHDILDNPSKFGDTYWGSAIHRQEQIMTLADSVQHMNEAYKNDIIQEYKAGENAAKHKVIPNGVKRIDKYTSRPKKKRIAYIGRFAKDKGIDEFVDALPGIFEKHPDAEIRIVGGDKSGKLVDQYKQKVRERMLDHFKGKPGHDVEKYIGKVEFTGWVEDKEALQDHYRWTDYVIIPSRAESFSLTATEALMHKRIPIMTKTKALDDLYISKGIGLGIDYDQRHGQGIAKRVNEILDKDNSKEYDAMVEKGRKFALENYSFENMVDMQLDSYREILGMARSKPRKKKVEVSPPDKPGLRPGL